MTRIFVLGVFCVSYVMSMTTTHGPHHHHTGTHHGHTRTGPTVEPAEHERFRFIYEPHAHMMLVVTGQVTGSSCYIFSLTDSERAAIHTDVGIRAVEVKLLSSLSTVSVHEVAKDQLGTGVARACGHVAHYFKERVA